MNIDETHILNEKFYDENKALACLLADDICFLNVAKLAEPTSDAWNTVVYVLANDIFAWGCADAESISNSDGESDSDSEIIALYKLWKENTAYGPVKWLCLKRNMQPQHPVKKDMINAGYWDNTLESLPKNSYDEACKKHFK